MRLRLLLAPVAALAAAAAPPAGAAESVVAGPVRATLHVDPLRLVLEQRGSVPLRSAVPLLRIDGTAAASTSGLRREGDALMARVRTAGGREAVLRITPAGDGSVAFHVDGGGTKTAVTWALGAREQLLGTGERSDAVDRRGRETEHYVADGPFRAEDRRYVAGLTPPWATRDRDDATYFPVPWILLDTGWGVHVAQDETSRVAPVGADAWRVEADAPTLRLVVHGGPTPAKALERFTAATGRQPPPAAPWTFGPWFQTGQPNVVAVAEERAITGAQRGAGVPVSVAETQMHHLPCGAHEGRIAQERERTESFHADGLSRLVYFNPSLCVSYAAVFGAAAQAGVLQKVAGVPFAYPAFVGGAAPLGFSAEPLAQFDFTHPATGSFYAGLVREAVEMGVDGWMEDFGESTPPQAVLHNGSTGDAAHNRYPTDYHCTLHRIARGFGRPLVRHQRSGWTGAAACADVVWGGDPTTVWGFDGLSSAVTQLLSAGLSGISRWATDIGGYNSFGANTRGLKPGETEEERLTDEMLDRWVELGALTPVMRTKRSGVAIPSYARPQVFDREHLAHWRHMTELHQALNRYLHAADEEHRRSGLPIARHHVLTHPEIPGLRRAHDQYLLGPDLLAAPVTAPGVRERDVVLPPGRWLDWWATTRFDKRTGAFDLASQRPHRGARTLRTPAPIGRPPLLLRVGAVLPLLDPHIDTLTGYGAGKGLVRLADREDRLRIIAVPRGTTGSDLGAGAAARSIEGRGRWLLRLRSRRALRWEVQAGLGTLRRPFHVARVLASGRTLPRSRWRYDRRARVLRVTLRGRAVRLDVRASRSSRRAR